MIKVNVVEQCPHTVTANGVMRVSHDVLGILAGAVYDKEEWIALLVGTRSEGGLDITVTGLKVPLQERAHASCELARPEPLTPDVVGVIHSHHNMGAFFSQTDHDTLNPRFPSSLVIAHVKGNSSKTERLLGFSYQAEGRAILPCGSPGIVGFTVIPEPALPDWPEVVLEGFGEPDTSISLYHCPHITKTEQGLVSNCDTACGIKTTGVANAAFGCNGTAFLAEVKEKTQKTKWKSYQGNVNGYAVVDNRKHQPYHPHWDDEGRYDERLLKHWGL